LEDGKGNDGLTTTALNKKLSGLSMNAYLDACKKLSLTARFAVGLVVFEHFCRDKQIESTQVKIFCDYLWDWPLIQYSDQFDTWENARPELVNCGLSDPLSAEMLSILADCGIDESCFRSLLTGLVDILWSSFWGAAEDNLSLHALESVLRASRLEAYPVLTPFKFSQFVDGHGWGEEVTIEDRDFWRYGVKFVPISVYA